MAKASPPGPHKTFANALQRLAEISSAMGFVRPSTAAQHTAGTLEHMRLRFDVIEQLFPFKILPSITAFCHMRIGATHMYGYCQT